MALLRIGVGVAAVGVVALLVVAFVDLGKADQIASVTGVVLAVVGLVHHPVTVSAVKSLAEPPRDHSLSGASHHPISRRRFQGAR